MRSYGVALCESVMVAYVKIKQNQAICIVRIFVITLTFKHFLIGNCLGPLGWGNFCDLYQNWQTAHFFL